jgi:hypothetical protein
MKVRKNLIIEFLNNTNITLFDDTFNSSDLIESSNKIKKTAQQSLTQKIKYIVDNEVYKNTSSPLYSFVFNIVNGFVVISTNSISDNLRHVDKCVDRILHQCKVCVFDSSHRPLFYVEKEIAKTDNLFIGKETTTLMNACKMEKNSYVKQYVIDKLSSIKNNVFDKMDFDKSIITVNMNHIGKYIVIFHSNDKWYFCMSKNIFELKNENHPILYNHVKNHIKKFNVNHCYHIILVDSRQTKLINHPFEINKMILIKTTEKYTLNEVICDVNDLFIIDKNIPISCMDELMIRLIEFEHKNVKNRKLFYRGLLMKIKIDEYEPIHIAFDTDIYKNLCDIVPKGLSIYESHIKLYQNNQLNYFLHYVDDSYNDIVKRINTAMSVLSREILDIYHMTRKKKNSTLYSLLPNSYKQILYQLHSDYIIQKNENDKINDDISDNNSDDKHDDFETCESKISISVEDVYNKLKELDIHLLVELFKNRDILSDNINNYINNNETTSIDLKNPIKQCTYTKIQTRLLK